jgi:hypothetical protein
MSDLWSMLQDSYMEPQGPSPHSAFTSPPVKRGSASTKQLSYIEKLSHESGAGLAEIRFGKSLMELSSAEASLLIGTLSRC